MKNTSAQCESDALSKYLKMTNSIKMNIKIFVF